MTITIERIQNAYRSSAWCTKYLGPHGERWRATAVDNYGTYQFEFFSDADAIWFGLCCTYDNHKGFEWQSE